jgi:hypothetical protein
MFQINSGSLIKKYSNGVMLESSTHSDDPDSIQKVLNFPFNVYITDHESKVVTCNETNAYNNNIVFIEEFKGYSLLKLVQKKAEGRIVISNNESGSV